MFAGSYERSLDEKGRLVLPPLYRPEYASGVYVSRSPSDPCLLLQNADEYADAANRLNKRVRKGKVNRHELRLWTASVVPASMDSQGRVPLPQNLRDELNLDRNVIVIGVVTHAEVWDPDAWASVEANRNESVGEGTWQ